MKFFIQREEILPALQHAASITSVKTGAVYLRSIWLKVENDQLRIMATDSNIEFFGVFTTKIEEDGLVGVNGRHLFDLIRKLSPGELQFLVDEKASNLVVKQNKRKYVLPINENYWFQPLSVFPEEQSISLSGETLSNIIDKVSYSVSDDETLQAFNCMLIKYAPNDQKIDFCGLNGHQLALCKLEHDDLRELLPEQGILISQKYLQELKRMIPLKEIELNILNNRLYCRSVDHKENINLPLSLYEYPDYNQLLAKYNSPDPSGMDVSRHDLMDALDRILIFNTENSMCTFFEFKEGIVQMDVQSEEKGEAKEFLDVIFQGNLNKIAFPTRDLIQILSHFTADTLHFHFTSSDGPCFIEDKDDTDYKVLIMPMHISNDVIYTETDM
ncbi:DNA polymerase III subunit beta [Desulfonatronum thioautotrophicum]|uniref:DNA polymerase III subunit beta n=1 Tax=Desulfonatronum thioautotrophicum TaxID=617001 RepID=UPI0005EB8BFA|nr:DNA polymerase III subunit beta [Desulfonatronum thioautotrophicum]